MEVLDMLNPEKVGVREKTEPINFPVQSEKYGKFFIALNQYKKIRYSWKIGVLVVRGCEPVSNVEFALDLGRFIPSVEDMLRVLAVSGVEIHLTEWEGYISEAKKNDLESMTGKYRICLPAPNKNFPNIMEMIGLDKEILNAKKEKMMPIIFPTRTGRMDEDVFFRVLEECKRVTYSWGSGKLFTNSSTSVSRMISHEQFAKAVNRTINTSAEMLELLSVSGISFSVTYWWDFFTEKQMKEFLDCSSSNLFTNV
jgi:hypothetical protein